MIWTPQIVEPGSGDSSDAACLASSSCCSWSKRWNKRAILITETWPCKQVSDLSDPRVNGSFGGTLYHGASWGMKLLSNRSPERNDAGNDSSVDRKSSWPRAQKSVSRISRVRREKAAHDAPEKRSLHTIFAAGNPSKASRRASVPTIRISALNFRMLGILTAAAKVKEDCIFTRPA